MIALLTAAVMILVCPIQPLNGFVFVLDGFLIGARHTGYLMKAMIAGAAIMIPIAWSSLQLGWSLMGILLSITALMCWRAATNLGRFVGKNWQRWALSDLTQHDITASKPA